MWSADMEADKYNSRVCDAWKDDENGILDYAGSPNSHPEHSEER